MLIKPNWDNFKAKFSENPQDNFEWFCYLLFSKEYKQPYGTHRYKNQSGIETDPIEVGDEVIGWQSKFYEDSLSNHKEDLLGTLTKTKRDNPNITKIILYTNSEWGQGQGTKEPKAKTETEEKAKELEIELIWRVQSYFESPFVCQEQRDISGYFFELNTKWELSSYGFIDTLKEKYLKDFSTISLLTTNTSKPIDEIFINIALIEDGKNEDIQKIISHESFLDRDDFPHDEEDFIDISELLNQSLKSLIYGTAGIGKTTLCKNISYRWAKGEIYQEFDYVIYIPLRQWKNDGIKGAIRDYFYSKDVKSININFDTQKTLFLFDGYDELDSDKKERLIKEINYYSLSHYLITSRPYGYEKNDFSDVKQHFETVGFTPANVEKYIESFFEKEKQQQSLKDFLEANINIKALSYIPLMLEMICIVWKQQMNSVKQDKISSMSMTKLYQKVVEYLLKEHAESKEDKSVYETRARKKIEKYFSQIAFEGLKKQRILFDYDFLEKIFIKDDELDFFENNVINSGFLKSDLSEKSLLDNNFEFLHLTFQEYFSALYVSKLDEKEQRAIISKYKFYPHFQVFFVFLAGLIKNKTLLIEEIGNEPKDIFEYYEILFIMNVSSEIKAEELDNTTVININKKLKKQIEITCRNDSGYDIIFENLKKVTHIIDDDTIEILLDIIELEEDEFIERDIIDTFFILKKYDEKYKRYIEQIKMTSNNESIKQYIFNVINNTEEQEAKEFQDIIKDFKSIPFRGINIYYTLRLMQKDEDCNKEIKKAIMNIFDKHNIFNYQKWISENFEEILESLTSVAIEEDSVMDELKLNSQDNFIDIKIREESLTVIQIIEKNSENIVEELIDCIQNKNLNEDTVSLIIDYLDEIIEDKEYLLSLWIKLWEDDNIHNEVKYLFVDSIDYTSISNDKTIDIIFTAWEKGISSPIRHFGWLKKYDQKYIDRFIKLLENEMFYEAMEEMNNTQESHDIDTNFAKIAEQNFYAHYQLISLSEKELNENINREYFLFLNFYLWKIKTSVLFQDYDEKLSSYFCLFEHITHNNKVLFIEDNKLCTISDGKKIYTQRDVDDEFLEELLEFINGNDLND